MTDTELKQLLRSSPYTAHRAVFDEYFNYVYTIVYNRLHSTGCQEDIDECVGDVFSDVFMYFE